MPFLRSPIITVVVGLGLWGSVSLVQAQSAEESCSSCHADQIKKIKASAHADVGCTTCHENHDSYPHKAGVPKPKCADCHSDQAGDHAASAHGQALKHGNSAAPTCDVCHGDAHELKDTKAPSFHAGIPDTCGMCHSEIAAQFKASVHGKAVAKGIPEAPVCTSCHGEHKILAPASAASMVNARHVRETCGQCHGNVQLARRFGLPTDRIVSFDESFHGLAAKAGSQTVANCASCHGVHNILPSSEAKSMINPANLPKTCGQCHPGAGTRFAMTSVHQLPGKSEPPSVHWARIAYIIIIPATLGFMILHNFGDWLRKLWKRRFEPAKTRLMDVLTSRHREVRMYPFERIQHALLATSFIVLCWTGFALKYPDQFWAKPLVMWEQYFPVRGVVHRVAAGVMIACSLIHVLSLISSRMLREHWKGFLPRRSDVPELILNTAYNLGLAKRRPVLSSHSYIEKMEYWAVVWGTIVMGITGVILWANNLALRYLPKEAIDFATTVHFYEAVLAGAAIVIWHFYSVIFDPDVYPLETAFLTGVSVKEEEAEAWEAEEAIGEQQKIHSK